MDCLFCKIAAGEIPSNKLYEDQWMTGVLRHRLAGSGAFSCHPQTAHCSVSEINADNSQVVARIFERIAILAKELGLTDGYRVVTNIGAAAGQTVAPSALPRPCREEISAGLRANPSVTPNLKWSE